MHKSIDTTCTGPAISDFRAQKDLLAQRIRGLHTIEFKAGKHEGTKVTIHVSPVILPQGAGALLSAQYLQPGKTVALLDIGFGTAGYLVFEWKPNEPRPVYADLLSGSLRLGMHVAQKSVLKRINESYGVDLLLNQIEEIMRTKYVKEIRQDVSNLIDEECRILAGQIVENIKPVWGRVGRFDELLVGGGGAVPLMSYIQETWPGTRQIYKSQAANALGSLSAAIAEFKNGA